MSNELQDDLAMRVRGLDPAARRSVYERAREALQNEVRAAAPFMPVQTVVTRRRELENAIMAVEREAAKADPPRPRRPVTPPVETPAEPAAEAAETAAAASAPESTETADEMVPDRDVQHEAQPQPAQEASAAPAATPSGLAEAQYFSGILEAPLRPRAPADSDPPPELPEPQPVNEPAATKERAAPPPPPKEQARIPESLLRDLSEDSPRREDDTIPDEQAEIVIETRGRPLILYVAVVALVLCAAALAALLVGFSLEAPPSTAAREARPRPAPAALPKPATPEAKLLRDAGFVDAAKHTLEEGNTHLSRREYARAIASYDDTIRLDPDNVDALRNRAYANWKLDRVAAAIRDFSAAIDRAPSDVELRYNRAVAYNRVEEFQQAVADLDRVIAAQPTNAAALNSRCWARAVLAHLEEALADCNEAVKLSPGDADILDSRGFVFLRLGRLDRAIADYNAALTLRPRLAGALYGRGLAKIGRGDRAGGQEDVTAARAIEPGIVEKFASYGIR